MTRKTPGRPSEARDERHDRAIEKLTATLLPDQIDLTADLPPQLQALQDTLLSIIENYLVAMEHDGKTHLKIYIKRFKPED